MKKLISLLIIFLSFQVVSQKLENSLLWEISGNGLTKPSYVFGTIHSICEEDYFMPNKAKQKLKKSDALYLEINLDDKGILLETMKGMKLPDSVSLKDLFSNEEYDRVKRFFKDTLNMPFMFFKNQKPYVIMSMISLAVFDCKTTAYENKFLELARELDMEIGGLESVEFQLGLFDKIPLKDQADMVIESMDDFDEYKILLTTMISAYINQDIEKLYEIIVEDMGNMPDFEKDMLEERNKNWVVRFNELSKEKSIFYAVGSGHLAGETGFLKLLEKEGYTVKPLLK
jgi:uncharacterized protein YbaP (TraB family)